MVPEVIHSKWDAMLAPYKRVVAKADEKSYDHYKPTASFKTRDEIVVNLNDFASRMVSVLYKLEWAAKSLECLTEFYREYTGSLDNSMRGMTKPLPSNFIFNTDVFFCFAYGALDIIGGILNTLTGSKIKKHDEYFARVLDFLVSSKSSFQDTLFTNLKRENDAGWICELRQYRNFVTHHAAIQPHSQFKYTAKDRTTEINLFMLPDDPKRLPSTYEKKREIPPYCQEVLEKELDAMKGLFGALEPLI